MLQGWGSKGKDEGRSSNRFQDWGGAEGTEKGQDYSNWIQRGVPTTTDTSSKWPEHPDGVLILQVPQEKKCKAGSHSDAQGETRD